MVSDKAESELADMVEGTPRTLDWAKEQYEAALEDVNDRLMEDVSDEKKREFALGMVESEKIFKDRVGGSGDEMELEILAIGQAGQIDNWGDDNDSVVYSYGFIYGPLKDDGGNKAARAVFINKASDGVDLTDVKQKFHAENTMKGIYEVSESNDLDGVYRCFSNGSTNLVEGDLDNLPSDRDAKLDILRRAVPEAKLATLAEDMSSYDPETGYTHDFGADLRRIEGKIIDYYIPDDRAWGRYTIMDDSVTQDDIVGTDIVGDDQNVPGLTVWADPDYHMEYGRKTRADFFGTVEEGSNGNLNMNLVGIIPIIPMPMDDENKADSNANTTETSL